jgi:ABC-type transport system substrate-binding protein
MQSAVTYPYDPARSFQLLTELGWTRAADGVLRNGRGEPFEMEVRTTTGADNVTESSIVADGLNRLGIQTTQNALSEIAQRDQQYRTSFPGINLTARSIRVPGTMVLWTSGSCPNPQQNFVGDNRGCWKNPEFDRWFQVASTSLDETERTSAIAAGLRVLTSDVGVLGMSYNSENIAVRKGLVGPGPRSSEQVGETWNIFEWRWTS